MIDLSLGSVLLNPENGQIYTPNTNQTTKISKGGEKSEE